MTSTNVLFLWQRSTALADARLDGLPTRALPEFAVPRLQEVFGRIGVPIKSVPVFDQCLIVTKTISLRSFSARQSRTSVSYIRG
jgi:hypothetical protein